MKTNTAITALLEYRYKTNLFFALLEQNNYFNSNYSRDHKNQILKSCSHQKNLIVEGKLCESSWNITKKYLKEQESAGEAWKAWERALKAAESESKALEGAAKETEGVAKTVETAIGPKVVSTTALPTFDTPTSKAYRSVLQRQLANDALQLVDAGKTGDELRAELIKRLNGRGNVIQGDIADHPELKSLLKDLEGSANEIANHAEQWKISKDQGELLPNFGKSPLQSQGGVVRFPDAKPEDIQARISAAESALQRNAAEIERANKFNNLEKSKEYIDLKKSKPGGSEDEYRAAAMGFVDSTGAPDVASYRDFVNKNTSWVNGKRVVEVKNKIAENEVLSSAADQAREQLEIRRVREKTGADQSDKELADRLKGYEEHQLSTTEAQRAAKQSAISAEAERMRTETEAKRRKLAVERIGGEQKVESMADVLQDWINPNTGEMIIPPEHQEVSSKYKTQYPELWDASVERAKQRVKTKPQTESGAAQTGTETAAGEATSAAAATAETVQSQGKKVSDKVEKLQTGTQETVPPGMDIDDPEIKKLYKNLIDKFSRMTPEEFEQARKAHIQRFPEPHKQEWFEQMGREAEQLRKAREAEAETPSEDVEPTPSD